MRKENQIYEAYRKNPVDGISMCVDDSYGGAVNLKSNYRPCQEAVVYADGSIMIPGTYADRETALKILKEKDPKLCKLALAVANDLKILALRESCRESVLFQDGYDSLHMNERLRAYEKETGCIVSLTEDQKRALYEDLLGCDPSLMEARMTEWFYKNHIPFVHTGKVILTVNGDARSITLDVTVDKYCDEENVHEVHEFEVDDRRNLAMQFDNAMYGIYKLLGYNPKKERT